MASQDRSGKTAGWRAHPNFVLLVVGFAIFSDMFLFACITPVLPFILQTRLHVHEDAIQSAISASLTVFHITAIFTPGLVAFFGRRQALRRPLYMIGLLCLAIATILLYFARTLAVFLVSRILQGASGSIVWVIGMGMICDAVGIDNLGQATGTVFGLAMMGAMIAPAIGGALYRFSGFEGILVVSLAILAIDFILRVLARDPDQSLRTTKDKSRPTDPETSSDSDHVQADDADERTPLKLATAVPAQETSSSSTPLETNAGVFPNGLKKSLLSNVPILRTLSHPVMWASIAIVVFQAIALSFIDAAIPLRLWQTLAFDAFKAGLMLLTITGMIVIVAPAAGYLTDRYQPRLLAVIGLILIALGLALLGLPLPGAQAPRIAAFAVYLAILGLGIACLDSPAFVASAKLVQDLFQREPETFGGVPPYVEHQALIYTFYSAGMVLGPLITAGLLEVTSFEIFAFALSAVTLVLTVVTFLYLKL